MLGIAEVAMEPGMTAAGDLYGNPRRPAEDDQAHGD